MEERQLILLLKQDDRQALCLLIDKYGGYVARILQSFLGAGLTREDLEELTADVFFALWQARARLKEDGNLKAYIASTAKNMGRKRLKRQKVTLPLPEDYLLYTEGAEPMEQAEGDELRHLVRQLLLEMTGSDREIFYRYYFLSQTTGEIAKCTGLAKSTIMSRLFRGRKSLKKQLQKNGFDDWRKEECLL